MSEQIEKLVKRIESSMHKKNNPAMIFGALEINDKYIYPPSPAEIGGGRFFRSDSYFFRKINPIEWKGKFYNSINQYNYLFYHSDVISVIKIH